ncbi:MAG TPA: phosphatidylserine decarboxylase [Burkholderiales bacterium]|nr:phosphatidylserine decarboxylase [Burkholderiales bacterium]
MNYPHPIIAREGWSYFAIAVVGSVVATLVAPWYCSLPLWLASLFVLQFFRDPPRRVPDNDRAVVSPADGRIVTVERAQDPYLLREALKVSVFMNAFNVHSNRSPVTGRIEKDWYYPGAFFNAALSKASEKNERKALWIKTADGLDIVCVQVAGLIARRILCYARSGDSLARGQRYGFIRFGSRVDVYLPPGVLVKTGIGDKVYGGESILAELPR